MQNRSYAVHLSALKVFRTLINFQKMMNFRDYINEEIETLSILPKEQRIDHANQRISRIEKERR